jgi:tRNA pseudouridine38-40 synthase
MTSTRYFLTLAYHGASFHGWQVQPNAPSVQSTLEAALQTLLQQPVEVTGCGRTDSGVHARYYVAHFNANGVLSERFLPGLNSLLPPGIAVFDVQQVAPDAHARFDAFERSYTYYVSFRKDPFTTGTAWFYPQHKKLDVPAMQAVAALLPQYNAFFPFCKTDSGVEAYTCTLQHAHWEVLPHGMAFHITANRFLRGMVRLIVGACVQAGRGQISAAAVADALDRQVHLPKSLSVPPEGLFLTDVRYPKDIFVRPPGM